MYLTEVVTKSPERVTLHETWCRDLSQSDGNQEWQVLPSTQVNASYAYGSQQSSSMEDVDKEIQKEVRIFLDLLTRANFLFRNQPSSLS